MVAGFPDFKARLRAVRSTNAHVFALAGAVAGLRTQMSPALQLLATNRTASWLFKPARLVLEILLATYAPLLHEKGAWWTRYIVWVAVVRDGRMTTCPISNTVKATFRRPGATRLWRLEYSTAAMAAYLVKNRFRARGTRPRMTELLTLMFATLQRPTTLSNTDMFWLNLFVRCTKILLLSLCGYSGNGFLLASTAVQVMQVASTVELSPANPHTFGSLYGSLVTN